MKRLSILIILCFMSVACGGGGGGDSTPFYAGIWAFTGYRVVNDCNVPSIPSQASVTLTVNQDNKRVVLQSGKVTLEGTVDDKTDGFTVSTGSTTSEGCQLGTSYVFRDASDGEADVGMAMVMVCGTRQCTIGYGGTAVRQGGKAYTPAGQSTIETLPDALANQMNGGGETNTSDSKGASDIANQILSDR